MYVTSDPKPEWLKTTNIYYFTISVGQEYRTSLVGWFWLVASHEVAIKPCHWVELQSSQDLNGVEGSTSSLRFGCCFASVPPKLKNCGLFHWASHKNAACFPQCEGQRGTETENPQSFYKLILEVIPHHFCPSLVN